MKEFTRCTCVKVAQSCKFSTYSAYKMNRLVLITKFVIENNIKENLLKKNLIIRSNKKKPILEFSSQVKKFIKKGHSYMHRRFYLILFFADNNLLIKSFIPGDCKTKNV